jgi:hypothetical protein
MPRGLINIQTIDASSPLVGTHTLERPPQVLCRQRRLQQRRPCASGCMSRAERFVAGSYSQGFTPTYGLPPRVGGHLTLCFPHRHIEDHSCSFGPSSAGSSLLGATTHYYGLC